MTNQEIFEKAINGLLTQNAFAFNSSRGRCVYYDPENGNRCAVGLLLPVETAKRWADDLGISSIGGVTNRPEPIRTEVLHNLADLGIGEDQIEFLDALQELHDAPAFVRRTFERDRFISEAREFATEHNLNMDFIDA